MAFNGIFDKGLWSCGFDFLADGTVSAGNVFDFVGGAMSVGSANARFAGKGMRCNGNIVYVGRNLNINLPTLYCGFAFKTAALGATAANICTFWDGTAGVTQQALGYNSLGQIGFYQIGQVTGNVTPTTPVILSSAGVVVPNSYAFVECLLTISPSSGVLQVKYNGALVANFAGNTRTTANAYVNRIYWGSSGNSGSGADHSFDDIYILDNTGAAPFNTFLGNMRIQTDGPNAASATGGLNAWAFTTPQGSDFANCANIPPNAAQFNSSSTVGQRMSFRFPALSGASRVLGLNTWYNAQEDSAGARTILPIYRSNAIDQNGEQSNTLTGSYVYYNQPSSIDPNTGLAWASGSVAAAGSCEIGLEVDS